MGCKYNKKLSIISTAWVNKFPWTLSCFETEKSRIFSSFVDIRLLVLYTTVNYVVYVVCFCTGLFGLPKRSGKLMDLTKFDTSFFGVHPKQADCMDPQLRMLLEVTYEAIHDAGGLSANNIRVKKLYCMRSKKIRHIGVYILWIGNSARRAVNKGERGRTPPNQSAKSECLSAGFGAALLLMRQMCMPGYVCMYVCIFV